MADAEEFLLLNPGPVSVSEDVLAAMDEPLVSHRSRAFEAVYERVQAGLDYVFERSTLAAEGTSEGGTSLALNGTATMGMEAAVSGLVEDDSEVVALVNGKFGRRFARIAERHARCERVEVEWGEAFDLEAIYDAIGPDTDLVTMVHNETSTGLLNPVSIVGGVAADHDARFVVDGVTSIGGDVFRVDDWHVDVAVTDAQKCLAAPPGISAVYVSDRVRSDLAGEGMPFYEDLARHLRKAEDDQTPFTSAVPLFRAMAVALEHIREEGIAARIRRHRAQAAAFRDGFEAMGLELFGTASGTTERSNTVTSVALPADLRGTARAEEFFGAVEDRNVSISGGQAHLGGEIFRVSNMGNLTGDQILRGVRTVGEALRAVGVDVDVADSVEITERRLG